MEERIDLAVRIGNVLDDTLIARKLGVCRSVVCASPAYIQGSDLPRTPDDLRKHRCITHAYVGPTDLRLHPKGQALRIPVKGPLQSNEAAVTRRAALAGAGIAMLPTYFVSADLASGALIRLLPDCEPEPLGIHAAYLSRLHQPQLLRMMIDFLADRLSGEECGALGPRDLLGNETSEFNCQAPSWHPTKVAPEAADARMTHSRVGSQSRCRPILLKNWNLV